MKKILSLLSVALCSTNLFAQEPIMFDGQQDSLTYSGYTTIEKDRYVGAVSVITGEQLRNSGGTSVSSAISGLAMGLFNTGSNIRGNSSPLVIIDGQRNRSMGSITVEEVENVYIFRDATAKMMYGSHAANGVISIVTKRGKEGQDKYVKVNAEFGHQRAQYIPEYLDSYDYAVAYNQARVNDGFIDEPYYSDEELEGYRTGEDLVKYPNTDFYDTFLNDWRNYTRANVEMGGSKDEISYFFNGGYYGDSGLQKVGENNYNRLNVRTNLDYRVNDYMSVYADAAARWDMTDRSHLTTSGIISDLSSHRPNAYPIFVGKEGDTDSLGRGETDLENLYGELTRKGYVYEETVYAQTNIGMKLDFNQAVKGLTGRVGLSYDTYTTLQRGQSVTYSRYQLKGDELINDGVADPELGKEQKFYDYIVRNFGLAAQLNYDRSFGKHDVMATAVFDLQTYMDKLSVTEQINSWTTGPSVTNMQDDKGMTGAFKLNYAYDNRYVAEGTLTVLGSNKFAPSNRWALFGSAGAAWNLHNESFLEDVDFINKLKLKASYGVMGYDRNYDYLLYMTMYQSSGEIKTGPQNTGSQWCPGYIPSQIANPSLTYEHFEELNLGLEANFLDNRLMVEANYFDEYNSGIPVAVSSIYPDYMGFNTDALPMINFNAIQTNGAELSLGWSDRVNDDFRYGIAGNVMYVRSVYDIYEQTPQTYGHEYVAGREVGYITGLQADGLYQNQADIDAAGLSSSFSSVLQPGDIKYKDYIQDGVVDSHDNTVIGNSLPKYTYNLYLNLQWKNLSLYVQGQGAAEFDKMLNNNSFYQTTGTNKYSKVALGAAVQDQNGNIQADASYPRLTSQTSGHSFRNSTYWMVDGDFFNLKTVQLTYSMPQSVVSKIKAQGLNVYLRCNNLASISAFKSEYGFDPINFSNGISADPTFRTFSIGVNLIY
ncbi:MAG: SusC/RagA family TonB-linked outer membrane protein [Rikenellaceae bacterium]